MAKLHYTLSIMALTALMGCAHHDPNAGRYTLRHDRLPDDVQDVSHVQDAIPRYEPYSAAGNKDYRLKGKQYRIIEQATGFSQVGMASWYGEKFHGHTTANGETYNMYSMSAAHKRLPLPSYVKVTNLDNNLKTIVRVNDRGPFHQGRIIDLSYAAAKKLGIVASGTGHVKIDVITTPPAWETPSPILPAVSSTTAIQPEHTAPVNELPNQPNVTKKSYYIQVVATSDVNQASVLQARLTDLFDIQGRTIEQNQVHKVQLGPFTEQAVADKLLTFLKQGEFSGAFKVYEN